MIRKISASKLREMGLEIPAHIPNGATIDCDKCIVQGSSVKFDGAFEWQKQYIWGSLTVFENVDYLSKGNNVE